MPDGYIDGIGFYSVLDIQSQGYLDCYGESLEYYNMGIVTSIVTKWWLGVWMPRQHKKVWTMEQFLIDKIRESAAPEAGFACQVSDRRMYLYSTYGSELGQGTLPTKSFTSPGRHPSITSSAYGTHARLTNGLLTVQRKPTATNGPSRVGFRMAYVEPGVLHIVENT